MSSFRFNFSGDSNDSVADKQEPNNEDDKKIEPMKWLESEEVVLGNQIENLEDIAPRANMFMCGDVEIGHVMAKEALLTICDNGLKNEIEQADKEHSDLVTGKYEGGLKIWECTYDLIQYVSEEKQDNINFKNLKVLDLGCGAGILGIFAFMNGASVTFQDYNKEVLESVTIPNVLLNIEEEDREFEIKRCKFYSGDWASFNKMLPEDQLFDIIFTSETIYNPDNYNKLIDLFLQRLAKTGTIYVAAKTYYFGVGGGTRQFEQSLEKNTLLNSKVCWRSSGGIQREILEVTRNTELFVID